MLIPDAMGSVRRSLSASVGSTQPIEPWERMVQNAQHCQLSCTPFLNIQVLEPQGKALRDSTLNLVVKNK